MMKTGHIKPCFCLYQAIFRRAQHTKPLSSIEQKSRNSDTTFKNLEPSQEISPNSEIVYTKTQIVQHAIPKTPKYQVQIPSKSNEIIDDKETFPTKVEDGNLTKIFPFLKNKKKQKVEYAPTTTEELNRKSEKTIFSDDEPVEFKTENLVKLDPKDPNLWYSQDAPIDLKLLPKYYLMLSKSRLTMLVCITSAAGYGLGAAVTAFDPVILALSTIGVGLTSASANAVNQTLEVPFDSQMNRTRNRVLVKGLLTPWHAMSFATVSGLSGALLLWNFVNLPSAILAVSNLFLYTSVYTPMKRLSIYNTWVGSVVGAIPPVIGWVSATGTLDFGALVLGGILYTWQFPHFNSLSWNLRPDYSRAGYRMMSVTDPELCKRVALRHSIGCLLVCSAGAPMLDVTSYAFALDSLPLNAYLVYLSWKFYQEPNSSSSRKLFRYTLIHLPLLMILMFISRKRKEIHAD